MARQSGYDRHITIFSPEALAVKGFVLMARADCTKSNMRLPAMLSGLVFLCGVWQVPGGEEESEYDIRSSARGR